MKQFSLPCLACAVMGIIFSTSGHAFEVKMGGGGWIANIDGEIGDPESSISASDLGLDEETHDYYFAQIEHELPVLPYLRIAKLNYAQEAQALIPVDFTFGDTTFTAGSIVDSRIDLSYTEASLYYPIFNDWLRVDLGLTVRDYDGFGMISGTPPAGDGAVDDTPDGTADDTGADGDNPDNGDGTGDTGDTGDTGNTDDTGDTANDTDTAAPTDTSTVVTENIKLEGLIPLLHLGTQLKLPFSNWFFQLNANHVGYSSDRFTDWDASIGYQSEGTIMNVRLDIGFRQQKIKLEDRDNFDGDLNIDGFYISTGLVF